MGERTRNEDKGPRLEIRYAVARGKRLVTVVAVLAAICSLMVISQPAQASTGSEVTIRMAVATGREVVSLQVNGATVSQFRPAQSGWAKNDYTYTHTSAVVASEVRVLLEPEPDEWDPASLQVNVDYVAIDGVQYLTEDAESYGSWTSATGCSQGFKGTVHLGCGGGWFQYEGGAQPSSTTAPPTTTDPGPTADGSEIVVRMTAKTGTEQVALQIGGQTVASWNPPATNWAMRSYSYHHDVTVGAGVVRVLLEPGSGDHQVNVDYIEIDGVRHETEDSAVESYGSWTSETSCSQGFKQTVHLGCGGGWFQFSEAPAPDPAPEPEPEPAPTPSTPSEIFVARQYQQLLERSPDAPGQAYWAGLIDATTYQTACWDTAVAVALNIAWSQEAERGFQTLPASEKIEALYNALIERNPSSAELAADQPFFDAGSAVDGSEAVLIQISFTDEYRNSANSMCDGKTPPPEGGPLDIVGGLTFADHVENQYQQILRRDSEQAGFDYHLGLLEATSTKQECVDQVRDTTRAFVLSAEAEYKYLGQTVGDRIEQLYRALLARPSDASGKSYWVSISNSYPTEVEGADAVATWIAASEEFKGRAESMCSAKPGAAEQPDPGTAPPVDPTPTPPPPPTANEPITPTAPELPFEGKFIVRVVGDSVVIAGNGGYGPREALMKMRLVPSNGSASVSLKWTEYSGFAHSFTNVAAGNYQVCVDAFRSRRFNGREDLGCKPVSVNVLIGPPAPAPPKRPAPPSGNCVGFCRPSSNGYRYTPPSSGPDLCSNATADGLLYSVDVGFRVTTEEFVKQVPHFDGETLYVEFIQRGYTKVDIWRTCIDGWFWDAYVIAGDAHRHVQCNTRADKYGINALRPISNCLFGNVHPGQGGH